MFAQKQVLRERYQIQRERTFSEEEATQIAKQQKTQKSQELFILCLMNLIGQRLYS